MRPVSKGLAYRYTDGQAYGLAMPGLIARLGPYCSYCERRLNNGIEVEHIQPKTVHDALEFAWSNFLVSCKNCNATKSKKDPALSEWLIPDRDNTAVAFHYRKDGVIDVRLTDPRLLACARKTLDLVGLNKTVDHVLDEHGNLVALDRRAQRLEAWLKADLWAGRYAADPRHNLEDAIVEIAVMSGFFSIWMQAFAAFPRMCQRFIACFAGTELACFDAVTASPNGIHPNRDGWADGGKV